MNKKTNIAPKLNKDYPGYFLLHGGNMGYFNFILKMHRLNIPQAFLITTYGYENN